MKRFLASSFFLVFLYVFAIGQTQTITARLAKKLVGQEVIVRGKLCAFANSSYAQTGWYYLGKDTAHRESSVVVHGKIYGAAKIWVGKYICKKVLIKGIVRNKNGLFLEATDTMRSR
jgi:hypothetical protein